MSAEKIMKQVDKDAYAKDIQRSIRNGKRRFISLLLIVALGVMMFSALKSACEDLRYSADHFFDQQNLRDIEIVSTLGLTQEDVDAVCTVRGVEKAEGIHSETVDFKAGEEKSTATLCTLTDSGINTPYLLEGSMPETNTQVLITRKLAETCGIQVGDSILLQNAANQQDEKEEAPLDSLESISEQDAGSAAYQTDELTVVGIATDVRDVNNPFGSVSYRTTDLESEVIFVLPSLISVDYYTAVEVRVSGTEAYNCYSQEYMSAVQEVRDRIADKIKEDREKARTEAIRREAEQKLKDAESEANKELADAKKELEEGEKQLTEEAQSGQEQINAGYAELNNSLAASRQKLLDAQEALDSTSQASRAVLDKAQEQLNSGYEQLDSAQKQLDAGQATLNESLNQVNSSLDTLNSSISNVQGKIDALAEQTAQLDAQIEELDTQIAEYEEQGNLITAAALRIQRNQLLVKKETLAAQERALQLQLESLNASRDTLLAQKQKLDESQSQLSEQQLQIDATRKELDEKQAQINAGYQKLNNAQAEIDSGWEKYNAGKIEGENKLAEAQSELDSGTQAGRERLNKAWREYQNSVSDVRNKFSEAYGKLEEIDTANWYIRDRSALSGFTNIKNDADSIESLGTIFPIIFFVVAVLVALTAVTRMVDEDWGLIGTYKSLGFTNREIRRKYLLFTFEAGICGCLLGSVLAFIGLPAFIFTIFQTMYLLPNYEYHFIASYGLVGPFLFLGGILIAVLIACRNVLRESPATLMRPKSPRAGSRVLLEKIPFLWKPLSFLSKVTARNIFRYKRRMLMTIFGIAGCVTLLLFGFSVRDSVNALVPKQYDQTFHFDVLAVAAEDREDKISEYLTSQRGFDSCLNGYLDSIKIRSNDKEESATLIVIPKNADLHPYVTLTAVDGETVTLEDGQVLVTVNAGQVLDFNEGDKVSIHLSDLQEQTFTIARLLNNYLGNYVYMTQNTFESVFKDYRANGYLISLKDGEDNGAFAEALEENCDLLSCLSTNEMRKNFASGFKLMNAIVYIIIVMSSALAFVVLYTLSVTNISEREREIATIKVLGFYPREVHSYIDRETFILSLVGTALGMPLGWLFSRSLNKILQVSAIYLDATLKPLSYFLAAVLSLMFTWLINKIMDISLDKINPVEALKSVE